MKKLALILVLLIPVAIMGFSAFKEGDKDKKNKKKTEQREGRDPENALENQPAENEKVAFAEVAIENAAMEARQVVETADNDYRSYHEETEEVSMAVEFQLVSKIQHLTGEDVELMSFSRCPSGTRQAYFAGPENSDPYYHGIVRTYHGCEAITDCKFRINAETYVIGVSNIDDQEKLENLL